MRTLFKLKTVDPQVLLSLNYINFLNISRLNYCFEPH